MRTQTSPRHTHRPVARLARTVGWTGCVATRDAYCNGASHGGVTHVDTCHCGATRMTESNGRHSERGAWREAEQPAAAPVRYIASGSVRGDCGHQHTTVGAAYDCAQRDGKACARLGSGAYSDRVVVRADGSSLSASERQQLEDHADAVAQ